MTSLTLVRRVKARPSIVFEALTTPKGIASWWGPDAGPVLVAETDLRVGGRFRVRFRTLDGSEHESTGEYLEGAEASGDELAMDDGGRACRSRPPLASGDRSQANR